MKFTCPSCNDIVGDFVVRPKKASYKWYEFSSNAMFCPYCGAELEMERKSERWALLVLPLFVYLPLTLVLPLDNPAVLATKYLVWPLALIGMLMLYLKRKIVVVERSPTQR